MDDYNFLRNSDKNAAREWKMKYTRLKRVFEKAEFRFTEQTNENLELKKKNVLKKKKLAKLKHERDNLKQMCDEKCESNEDLIFKLHRIERRVIGVPKGQYLLKKNHKLQQKLKALRHDLEVMHLKTHEDENKQGSGFNNFEADDLIALVKDKHKIEKDNSMLINALGDTKGKNEELETSVKELWETNEKLRDQRMKDRENMIEIEGKNAELNTLVAEYKLKIDQIEDQMALLENRSNSIPPDIEDEINELINEKNQIHEDNERLSVRCSTLQSRLNVALDEVMETRKQNEKLQEEVLGVESRMSSISLRKSLNSYHPSENADFDLHEDLNFLHAEG